MKSDPLTLSQAGDEEHPLTLSQTGTVTALLMACSDGDVLWHLRLDLRCCLAPEL